MNHPAIVGEHFRDCDGNGSIPCWSCMGDGFYCDCGDGMCGDVETCPDPSACPECSGDGAIACPGCAK